jgi:hypothetical protein
VVERNSGAPLSRDAAEDLVLNAFEAARVKGWRLGPMVQDNHELSFEVGHHLSSAGRCSVYLSAPRAEASRLLDQFFANEEFDIVGSAPSMRHSLAVGAFRRLCLTHRWSPQVFDLYLYALYQLGVLDVEEVEWLRRVGPADFGEFGRQWRAEARRVRAIPNPWDLDH